MADLKISQLTADATLAGTEEFPFADGGVTKKILASDLTSQIAGMVPPGVDGRDGVAGTAGTTGATGPSGGPTGATGPAGQDGLDGSPGPPGGPSGAVGASGLPGAAGLDGLDGAPGTGGGIHRAYALIRDEKAANSAGGTFTSGAWQTRDMNTEAFDPGGIVSISSNQFVLAAGTYFIFARAPAFLCDRHKAKLYNVTDASDTLIGSSAYSGTNVQNDAIVQGRFTIAATKTYEIRHQCETTKITDGFGVQSNFSVTEVYTEVQVWREG